VLDRRTGPLFFTLTKLENVPGLPGISGVKLQQTLRKQVEDLGAEIKRANVVKASGQAGNFLLETDKGEQFAAKTLLLATGIARYHPTVNGDWRPCLNYAGKCNVYYCPDCEAPEIDDKETVVIGVGSSRGAVSTAQHLYEHSKKLILLLSGETEMHENDEIWASERNIPIYRQEIAELVGKRGCLEAMVLADGTKLSADAFFVSSPKVPRTDLAQQLGLPVTKSGHAEVKSQRGNTAVDGLWIAGDLRPMTQQVAIAMGTGNIAAVHIDQYLADNNHSV
jgi:thioredoxin reductase